MRWSDPDRVLPADGLWAELDSWRAWGPCVLEHPDGTLQMWYSGHDGSTARILAAARRPGERWRRRGVAIDAAAAGDTDIFGVDSPCVVRTAGGYLMAYAGSDGDNTRIHAAASRDGFQWKPFGPLLQRGDDDRVGATHPCVVMTGGEWRLYFAGYDGSVNSEHAAILGAVSANGASWDRFGVVLDTEPDETAVDEPCVAMVHRRFEMLYATRSARRSEISLATSDDGIEWDRRGPILKATGDGVVRSPWALRSGTGHVRLWFAATDSPASEGERLWSVQSAEPA